MGIRVRKMVAVSHLVHKYAMVGILHQNYRVAVGSGHGGQSVK